MSPCQFTRAPLLGTREDETEDGRRLRWPNRDGVGGGGGGEGNVCFKICALIFETDTQGGLSARFWLTERVRAALSPTGTSSGAECCWIPPTCYSRCRKKTTGRAVEQRQEARRRTWRGNLRALGKIIFFISTCLSI